MEEHWDLEIRPKPKFFDLNLQEVWRYRDLLWLFVRRDFVAQYKQTILGPVWHFIQPVLTTIMFLLIFGRIARIPTDGVNPILFYMAGITLWNYFSISLTNTSNTFLANASIFGKVYFPRLIIPLSIVFSNLIRFGIQLLLLFCMMAWFVLRGEGFHLTGNLLYIPFLVLLMAGIGLGLGIIISSLTTKYRDLSVLLAFAIQLTMYATPIIYPMSYLQEKGYAWLIQLNPLSGIVEAFRYSLFGRGSFVPMDLLYSSLFMFSVLLIGALLFNRVEKTFMDTV
jgi:lipopolysaccharide transport system permease protein